MQKDHNIITYYLKLVLTTQNYKSCKNHKICLDDPIPNVLISERTNVNNAASYSVVNQDDFFYFDKEIEVE